MFDGLCFTRTRFNFQLERPHRFNGFLGPILHRVVSRALNQEACLCAHRTRCEDCGLNQACAYSRILIAQPEPGREFHYKQGDAPRPYAITAPVRRTTDSNGNLGFELVLVGRDSGYLGAITSALSQIRIDGVEARLISLEDTLVESDTVIFSPERLFHKPPTRLSYERLAARTRSGVNRLILRFITPTHIQSQHKPVSAGLNFTTLLRAITRRLTMLAERHCGFRPDPEPITRLVERGRLVRVENDNLRPVNWGETPSAEEGTDQPIEGLVGRIEFSGPLDEFMPVICTGEYLHIGNSVTKGQGKYEALLPAAAL